MSEPLRPLTPRVEVQISTRHFSFMLPPSEIPPSPQFPYRAQIPGSAYPYNLPADAIGYNEFWTDQPHFSAFGGTSAVDEESSESESSGWGSSESGSGSDGSDSDESDETSEELEEDVEERPKIRIRLKAVEESDLSDAPEVEQRRGRSTRKRVKAGTKLKGKEKAVPVKTTKGKKGKKPEVYDMEDQDEVDQVPKGSVGGKRPKNGKLIDVKVDPQKKVESSAASVASESDVPTPAPRQGFSPNGTPLPSATAGATGSPSAPIVPTGPFYVTELVDTPGRPGHLTVDVPIPPSGSGPRPPPGPLIGLDGNLFIGPEPIKPNLTFASIIHRALTYLSKGRGTLGQVCNWVAGEWEWFRMNVDTGWQHSIRHNLSLSKVFLKVDRIPEDDPESKGSVWIIDPAEAIAFEEKMRKEAQKNATKQPDISKQRERERDRKERARVTTTYTPPPPRPTPPVVPKRVPAKGPVTIVIQALTPELRATSTHKTADEHGTPLPWACDGTTLSLDPGTFGYLDVGIKQQLSVLGADGAVAALTNWLTVKNKNAKEAAAAKANGVTKAAPVPTTAAGVATAAAAASVKPVNGTLPALKPKPASSPSPAPASSPAATTSPSPAPVLKPPPTNGSTIAPLAAKPDLSSIISRILAVTNARGDIKSVGPHAPALLRYIRHTGINVDPRTAMRIWETGVLPAGVPRPAQGVKRKAEEEVVGSGEKRGKGIASATV